MKYLSVVAVPLITLIIAQIIVFDLSRFRFSRKKLSIIILIEFGLLLLLNGTILIIAGLDAYARFYVFAIVIPAFGVFFYTSKRRDARDIFTIIITIYFSNLISIPAMWISQSFSNMYLFYNVARIVIFALLFFFIHTFFRKAYLALQDEVDKGWVIFSILPVLGSALLYYQFMRYSQNGNFFEVLYVLSGTIVVLSIVYGMILYMFRQLHEKYIMQEQQRILSMQNKAQEEQFLLYQEISEKSNRRWHDLRHTTQIMVDLLEQGNTEVAIEYLKDSFNMPSVEKEEYCHHFAVNSMMCLWAERCRKEDISLEISLRVPQELEIEPMELSALFSNAIENAYDSCLLIPKNRGRFIKVESQYNSKRLAIGVTNSCNDDVKFEEGLPLSSKEGGGIGTRSMIYTVKRFHGAYTFETYDGLFFTRLVLNV